MLAKDPTEELTYHLTRDKKCSFHFGEISLGVNKLLDAVKQIGYVVHLNDPEKKINLLSKEDCETLGIKFEHQVIDERVGHSFH